MLSVFSRLSRNIPVVFGKQFATVYENTENISVQMGVCFLISLHSSDKEKVLGSWGKIPVRFKLNTP